MEQHKFNDFTVRQVAVMLWCPHARAIQLGASILSARVAELHCAGFIERTHMRRTNESSMSAATTLPNERGVA
jgi:hypothetical protein